MSSRMRWVAGVAALAFAGRPIRPPSLPRQEPHRRDTKRRQAGFTLIELMVAVVLLSVGVLGVAQVLAIADRHTTYARTETIAVSLSQEIREKILSEDFSSIHAVYDNIDTSVPSTIPPAAAAWAGHLASELGPAGRGRVQVDSQAENPLLPSGLLDITITLTWTELGHAVSFPLQFMLAKTGP